jgi:hypothetical protein
MNASWLPGCGDQVTSSGLTGVPSGLIRLVTAMLPNELIHLVGEVALGPADGGVGAKLLQQLQGAL